MTDDGLDTSLAGQLWSDEPATIDLLAAKAVAETVADAILDDALDPLSIGLSGPWGSGKTTVLRLVAADLAERSTGNSKVVVVHTDPWRYDPSVGAKESIIADVLKALEEELGLNSDLKTETKSMLRTLTERVNWSKAIKLAAKTGLAMQIPSFEDITDLIKEPDAEDGTEGAPRGLAGFREEFETLMAADELQHVRRVAVLVDDLDRCLSRTVVESLEAIRLFLSVDGMAFVIAADEDRVADAIKAELPEWRMPEDHERPGGKDALPPEPPWKLYLHKIVQTTVPLPALGAFDTEAYLLLLQIQNRTTERFSDEQLDQLITACGKLRGKRALDELQPPSGTNVQIELAFAHRMTALMYQKLAGNPRRIKRFLNDMNIRRSIAARRGIELEYGVVAKLMVLEVLLPEQFKEVLGWLRGGELRDRLETLERIANNEEKDPAEQPGPAEPPAEGAGGAEPEDSEKAPVAKPAKAAPKARGERAEGGASESEVETAAETVTGPPAASIDPGFHDDLIRWAKLDPLLADTPLSPYLHLAASFSGDLLLNEELPERLRDVAAQLTITGAIGAAAADQQAKRVPPEDAAILIRHFGRVGRDRITEQRGAVTAIGRLAIAHPALDAAAIEAIKRIPAQDLQVGTAVHIRNLKISGIEAVIAELAARAPARAKQALTSNTNIGSR